MSPGQQIAVLLAGVAAGLINTVVGSGTLITFPVLIGAGLSPLTANVSNTVGLLPGSAIGAFGYRLELARQGRRVALLGVASVLGGITGALLLLVLPSAAFDAVIPAVIVLALLLVVFGPAITRKLSSTGREASPDVHWPLAVSVGICGIYGGYFGAAQGVVLMGLFGLLLADTIQRHNALKIVLAGMVNAVAAVIFMFSAHIDWGAAGLVALGSLIGGYIGAKVGRRLSPRILRAVIVIVGIVAIARLTVA